MYPLKTRGISLKCNIFEINKHIRSIFYNNFLLSCQFSSNAPYEESSVPSKNAKHAVDMLYVIYLFALQ